MKPFTLRLPVRLVYLFGRTLHRGRSDKARSSAVRCRRTIQRLEVLEDRIAAGSMLPLPGISGPWSDLALASVLGTDMSPSPVVRYLPPQELKTKGGHPKPPNNSALLGLSVLGQQSRGSTGDSGTGAKSSRDLLDPETGDGSLAGPGAGQRPPSRAASSNGSSNAGTFGPGTSANLASGAGAGGGVTGGGSRGGPSGTMGPLSGAQPGTGSSPALRLGTMSSGSGGTMPSGSGGTMPPGSGGMGSGSGGLSNTGYLGSTTLANLAQSYQPGQPLTTAQKLTFVFDKFNTQDRVLVNVRALPQANFASFQSYLQGQLMMGVTTVTPSQELVTGYLPIHSISQLAGVPGFASATPVYAPIQRATTPGNGGSPASDLPVSTHTTGAGVTVGDLSDSLNQGTSPYPGVTVLQDGTAGDTNEGRAMLDVIHSVAPGASLAFNTSDGGPQAMAQGIANLATQAHAQVIVDDTAYPNEPFFNNGVIAQAVNQVSEANNVTYVTAAGNEANHAWSDVWRPVAGGTSGIPAGTFENLSSTPGQVNWLQNFTLPVGQTLNLAFQWDAAYLEGGTDQLQYQVPNEIDVQIRDSTGSHVFKLFNDDTRNTAEALQRVVFTNDGSYGTTNFAMSFQLVNGPAPTMLKWVRFDNGAPAQYQGGAAVFGHEGAAAALTVGATPAANPTQAEPFSSQGGVTTLFDNLGQRLASPQVNNFKPDLVGPDQVKTSTLSDFTGTSAAAADVAGDAALLRWEYPADSFSTIAQELRLSAKPMGSAIPNPTTGAGLAQLSPLASLPQPVTGLINAGPDVLASHQAQNIAEETIAVNPTNPLQLFAAANPEDTLQSGQPGLLVSTSSDGGATWKDRIIANGTDGLPRSAGDPSVSWDQFGNLFLTYTDFNLKSVDVLLSTNGGQSFTPLANLAAADQPKIATGDGMVWVMYNNGNVQATGARVTGLGQVGAFSVPESVPNSTNGDFGGIAISPSGQVMVTYQNATTKQGPDTIMVSTDPDGLGPAGFSAPVAATPTNVGSHDPIQPTPNRTIDASAGLAFDTSNGPHRGRVYLVYTNAPAVGSQNTNIFVRYSDNNGASWSAPVQVNDDTSGNSHFLPQIAVDPTTGNVAVSWLDARQDNGHAGAWDTDGRPNTDVEEYTSVSLDGGVRFAANIRVANGPSNAATQGQDGSFDFGDYTGLTFYANTIHPAWSDNSATLSGGHGPVFALATAVVAVPTTSGTDQFDPNETSDTAHTFGTLGAGAPPQFGSGFAGMNFNDTAGFVPPDTDAAVGPNAVVEVVNSNIAFYSLTGTKLFEADFGSFFAPISPGTFLFDPVVTYDQNIGRFIVAVLDKDDTAKTSSIDVAISNTSDPTAGFTLMKKISITESNSAGTALWGDYPKIGWNAGAVAITVNMYDFTNNSFQGRVQVVTFDPGTITVHKLDRTNASDFTLAPASMYGAAATDPLWFVQENGFANGTAVDVVKMTNPLGATPTFTDTVLAVDPYTLQGTANEPGGNQLNADDTRMQNAVWRNNVLVASHNVGLASDSDVHARWYEFSTSGAAPTLTDQGTISPGTGISTFYPAISILADGTLGMSYMQSSASQNMSMYVTGRKPTDPPGTMETPVLAKAGEAVYTAFDGSPFRTGDFSGISVDSSGNSFWAANEYATSASSDNWGTWIQNFGVGGASGSFVIDNLTITTNPNGLPDYDWFRWSAGITGTLTVDMSFVGDLELHLFTVNSNNTLIDLADAVPTTGSGTVTVSHSVTAGEPILVEVKGQNTSVGVHATGVYDLGLGLT